MALSLLALSGRAEATIGGPTEDQMHLEIAISIAHFVSLTPVTLGDIFSGSRKWRTATFIIAPANILLSVGAVFAADTSCCGNDHRNGVAMVESISVAWSAALIAWAIVTRSPDPPPATAAILPIHDGAMTSLAFSL